MTTKSNSHGGSYVVTDGAVERRESTLNPGDAGYAERVKKAPIESRDIPGTLNRVPSFRDLEVKPAKTEKVLKDASKVPTPVLTPPAADNKGGK